MEKLTRGELLTRCRNAGIQKCSSKRKHELIQLLTVDQIAVPLQQIQIKMQILSLFCGCGGLDYGFHKHGGFSTRRAFDNNQHAVDTYNKNFSPPAEKMDINTMLSPEFELGFRPDLIMGGPPCQDFSAAGEQRLGERAAMTEVFGEVVCKWKPAYFIMENVPQIKSVGNAVYKTLVDMVKRAGYGLTERVVYMPDYGVPQSRSRFIMIGVLGEADGVMMEELDRRKHPVGSLQEYITQQKDDMGLEGKLFVYRHPRSYERRGVFGINELYPTVRGCIRKMPPAYSFHEQDRCKVRGDVKDPDFGFAARVQTFPKDFVWNNSKNNAQIIGNAVPPLFSAVLAEIIAEHAKV